MDKDRTLIEVKGLCKYFKVGKGSILKAVDQVSFHIPRGKVLGLVGESGCGKTTVGRLILRLLKPTAGEVFFDGVNINTLSSEKMRRLRRKMQIVFQDPYSSLNPRMTVGNMITFPMKVQNLYRGERTDRTVHLLEKVGLRGSDINRYPHEFSGGQLQRIGIARALAVDPEFIVADEPVSALDVSIRSQVLNLFKELQLEFHLTSLFIAHDLGVVEFISDYIAVLYMGKIVEIAPALLLSQSPQHPYTKILFSALPVPDPKIERRKPPFALFGEISTPIDPPPGCRFYSRCPEKRNECREGEPELVEIRGEHYASCFLLK
jgi:oligopeptide/dipeptide ABC transporter ATP-binding protein